MTVTAADLAKKGQNSSKLPPPPGLVPVQDRPAEPEQDAAPQDDGAEDVPAAQPQAEYMPDPGQAPTAQQPAAAPRPRRAPVRRPEGTTQLPPVPVGRRVYFGSPVLDKYQQQWHRARVYYKNAQNEMTQVPREFIRADLDHYSDARAFILNRIAGEYPSALYEIELVMPDGTPIGQNGVPVMAQYRFGMQASDKTTPQGQQPSASPFQAAREAAALARELAPPPQQLPTLGPMGPAAPAAPQTTLLDQMAAMEKMQAMLMQRTADPAAGFATYQIQQAADARVRDVEQRAANDKAAMEQRIRDNDRQHSEAMEKEKDRAATTLRDALAAKEREIERLNAKIDKMEERSAQPTPAQELTALMAAMNVGKAPAPDPMAQLAQTAALVKSLAPDQTITQLLLSKALEKAFDGGGTLDKLIDAVPKTLAALASGGGKPPSLGGAQQTQQPPTQQPAQPQQQAASGAAYSPELRAAVKSIVDAENDDVCVTCVLNTFDLIAGIPGEPGMGIAIMAQAAKANNRDALYGVADRYIQTILNDGEITLDQAGRIARAIKNAAPGERFVQELAKRAP